MSRHFFCVVNTIAVNGALNCGGSTTKSNMLNDELGPHEDARARGHLNDIDCQPSFPQ